MANEKKLKIDDVLPVRPNGRTIAVDNIAAEFRTIRQVAFVDDKKVVPGAKQFASVGAASGTHLLKAVTPRAKVGQCVVRHVPRDENRHPAMFSSLDAGAARVAKVVFRPLEIEGHATRSLADHILNAEEISSHVAEGFVSAFGEDSLEALRKALTAPPPAITTLPVAEFPIIFLPRPGGGDLQVTPLAPAEAYARFGEVMAPYFLKNEEGKLAPRGTWHWQYVSDKPQNISGSFGKTRTRFLATMPRVLQRWDAELHRYANGGMFPYFRDGTIIEAVDRYAKLIDTEHGNRDIRAGRNRRADALIQAGRDFIDEVVADAQELHPEAMLAKPPSIAMVLLNRRWPNDSYDRARRVLTGQHFRDRLKAEGEE
jgi:hypothetical protein